MAYFSMPMINLYNIFSSSFFCINKTALLGKLCGRFHQEFSIRGEFGVGVILLYIILQSSWHLASYKV